jgi:IPT/TIG domain
VVILGASFLKSNRLRVRFGEAAVPATFHESGTIICNTPPCTSSGPVRVSVTNDGRAYCKSSGIFSYQ